MRPNGVRSYLDDGDPYSVEEDDSTDQSVPQAEPDPLTAARVLGIPPAVYNAQVSPDQQIPVPPPQVVASPDAAAAMAAPQPPKAPGASAPDFNTSPYRSALEALRTQIAGAPKLTPPHKWQNVLAGAVGGMAGWSNAASRTRSPIDIAQATQGILHPGYSEKVAEFQSRVAPLQQVAEIEGQTFAAQQKAALDAAQIQHLQKQGDYYEGLGRTTMLVSPELEKQSNGLFRANTQAPVALVQDWLKDQAGRYQAKTNSIRIDDPNIAAELGKKVGDSVPIATYNAVLAKPHGATEAQTKDNQIKADYAASIGKSPAEVTDAEMNAARRMFGSGDPLITASTRSFIAQNKRLPTPAEEEQIINKAIQQKKQDITVINQAQPGDIAANAQMIANYQTAPLNGYVMRTPEGRAIMAEVLKINPDYHAEYYNNFNRTEIDATTGRIGTSANALNTMMGHLSVLNDAAKALKNNDIQALNNIANYFSVQTGHNAVTTYQAIARRLAPEVTRAYVSSGGSIGERGANESDFDAKLGPDQIKNNIAISAQLAESKIKALQDQYKRGTYGRGQQKLITDEAEAARQKLAGQGGVKTVSSATVHEYAVTNKIKDGDARQMFIGKGYRITR